MGCRIRAIEKFSDKLWRLNNLYWILDKDANRVKFTCNDVQMQLFRDMSYRNVVLKARQRGITTFVDLYLLDEVLFNANMEAAIIAHNQEDAQKIFRRKIKYPYDNLPPMLRAKRTLKTDSKSELHFKENNSTIFVSVSVRSSTLQYLHISEYAKICKAYPDKAEEIKTGSFPAVPTRGIIFVEGTAEGSYGNFYDLCQRAEANQGKRLTELDFKFHFYSWWDADEYELDPDGVVISRELDEYFERLSDQHGIELTDRKKAWYAKTFEDLGDLMFQEYPSTPEEAFMKIIKGAYYAEQIAKLSKAGQICHVPYDPGYPVNTGWDLGINDQTEIIFHQQIQKEHRIIDYYYNNGEPLAHYAKVLEGKGYVYGTHFLPHDVEARMMQKDTVKTRLQILQDLMPGQFLSVIPKTSDVSDSIETVRKYLPLCWVDEKNCQRLLKALREYQKEWNDKMGCYRNRPLHNWASDAADAFRTLINGVDTFGIAGSRTFKRTKRGSGMAV